MFILFHSLSLSALYVLLLLVFVTSSYFATTSLCELFIIIFRFTFFVSCLYFSLWAVYNYILLHLFFVSCWYIATPCLCERRLFLETNCNCVNVALFVLIPKTFFLATKRTMNLSWTYYENMFRSLILTFGVAWFFRYNYSH